MRLDGMSIHCVTFISHCIYYSTLSVHFYVFFPRGNKQISYFIRSFAHLIQSLIHSLIHTRTRTRTHTRTHAPTRTRKRTRARARAPFQLSST